MKDNGMIFEIDPRPYVRENGKWSCIWTIEKYDCYSNGQPFAEPYERLVIPKNILVYGGISCLWECLIGNGTASAGQALTYFNNAQAAVGVGDSATAAVATQTDLQAVTNKLRVGMNGGYPSHTDGVVSGAATITWQSTFGNSQANYVWAEIGVFNSPTLATGRMLNRLVQSLGTKAGGAWSASAQISLS